MPDLETPSIDVGPHGQPEQRQHVRLAQDAEIAWQNPPEVSFGESPTQEWRRTSPDSCDGPVHV